MGQLYWCTVTVGHGIQKVGFQHFPAFLWGCWSTGTTIYHPFLSTGQYWHPLPTGQAAIQRPREASQNVPDSEGFISPWRSKNITSGFIEETKLNFYAQRRGWKSSPALRRTSKGLKSIASSFLWKQKWIFQPYKDFTRLLVSWVSALFPSPSECLWTKGSDLGGTTFRSVRQWTECLRGAPGPGAFEANTYSCH